jgi:hypothetical protein
MSPRKRERLIGLQQLANIAESETISALKPVSAEKNAQPLHMLAFLPATIPARRFPSLPPIIRDS